MSSTQFGEWDDDVQRSFFDRKWIPEEYEIIVTDETDVGVISVSECGDYIFLAELQIHLEHQNRGLGSSIIRDIVARAESQKLPVRLQVLKANRVQALYHRLGFREISRTDTHLIMER